MFKLKNTLIFPAIHIPDIYLICSLESVDLKDVLVICEESVAEHFGNPYNFIVDDLKSMDRLFLGIEEWGKKNERHFNSIIGIDDEEQFRITKKIADYFKIDFYSDKTLQAASNKFVMKKRFEKNKVPTGKFCLVSNSDDSPVDGIKFPNVLKPVVSTGSEFIFFNRNKAELDKNIKILKGVSQKYNDDSRFNEFSFIDEGKERMMDPKKEFLLEEYVDGVEYSLDFSIKDSDIDILRIVKKFSASQIGCFSSFYLMNKGSAEHYGLNWDNLKEMCKGVASSLMIKKGVCMIDFKFVDGRLNIIETSIRPGLSTFIPLVYRLYGYTPLGIMIKTAQGVPSNEEMGEDEGMVIYLLAPHGGKLTKFDISRLKELSDIDVIDVQKFDETGDILVDTEFDHHDLQLGYMLVKNPGRENAEKIIKRISEAVVIEVKDG